jgi:hypothetical protein
MGGCVLPWTSTQFIPGSQTPLAGIAAEFNTFYSKMFLVARQPNAEYDLAYLYTIAEDTKCLARELYSS